MQWQQVIINSFEGISKDLERALDGLTVDDLNEQPHNDCNSIGWLAWHLTRSQDRLGASFTGEEQLWIKDKWHTRFNRPPNPQDSGFGHTPEDLAAFRSPDAQTVLAYHQAASERFKRCISNLSEGELDKQTGHPAFPTVGGQLVATLSDNLQHAGQIAYLRGLLKGKGWLPW